MDREETSDAEHKTHLNKVLISSKSPDEIKVQKSPLHGSRTFKAKTKLISKEREFIRRGERRLVSFPYPENPIGGIRQIGALDLCLRCRRTLAVYKHSFCLLCGKYEPLRKEPVCFPCEEMLMCGCLCGTLDEPEVKRVRKEIEFCRCRWDRRSAYSVLSQKYRRMLHLHCGCTLGKYSQEKIRHFCSVKDVVHGDMCLLCTMVLDFIIRRDLEHIAVLMFDNIDDMYYDRQVPVVTIDIPLKSATDVLINMKKVILSRIRKPVLYRFADWFFTKQILRVQHNHTDKQSLKQELLCKTEALSVHDIYNNEQVEMLQSMLFIVLGIDEHCRNLPIHPIHDVTPDDKYMANCILKTLEKSQLDLLQKLHIYLAQAKLMQIYGVKSKFNQYLKSAEALAEKHRGDAFIDWFEFTETLPVDDQRHAERTEQASLSRQGTFVRQSDPSNILDVWPAYEQKNPWKPIFVALTYSNIQGEWGTLLTEGGHIQKHLVQQATKAALQSKDLPIAQELRLSVAKYIRQSDPSDILDVWPAYEQKNPWEPIFVVLTYSNIQGEWGTVFGFRVFKRRHDLVSSEASIIINSKKVQENPLCFSDFDKLKTVTQSDKLIKKHSNITIVNACSCRSRRGGEEIYKETCVVIHCLLKGLIPFQEDPFPRCISGFPVDVREGYVTMGMNRKNDTSRGLNRMQPDGAENHAEDYEMVDQRQQEYHSLCEQMHDLDLVGPCIQIGSRCTDINPNLLIGSTISRTGAKPLTGTLGGFVRLSEEDMGFLTCAHVVGLNKGQTVSQPSHAELPPAHRTPKTMCGYVENTIFYPGRCDQTGIDAAVVNIIKRRPTDGDFIWVPPESQGAAGFASALKFSSGKVLTRDELRENRRRDVIKVGSQSGLTRGSLYLTETFVRISNRDMILPGGEKVEFYNQMEIQSHAGSKAFFELGDSGSLVFMQLNNNELHCIGLALGKTSYSSCLVTPISAVLESLRLKDKLMQFGVINAQTKNGVQCDMQ